MYQLDETIYFYAFALLPILWLGYLWVNNWKKKTQANFSSSKILDALSPYRSSFKPLLKMLVVTLGFSCFIIALVNPKIGTQLETVKREGVDIVFAIDVSKSMLAEDIAPNRLEKAKRLVSALLNDLASDRVGIIAYAAQAVPQLPITTDYGAAKMFLQALNTDMLSSQGTAIDAAINLASTYFDDEEQTNRVVFILSDGEDHAEDGTIDAAQAASAMGIKIFTLGVGTEKGSPIPIKRNGIVESYKKDENNEVVITKRNPTILESIASTTDAAYMDGNDTQAVLAFVREELKQMEKKEFEAKKFVSYKDRFQPFLIAGFLLFLIDILLLETKTKWVLRLNLFNEKDAD